MAGARKYTENWLAGRLASQPIGRSVGRWICWSVAVALKVDEERTRRKRTKVNTVIGTLLVRAIDE